MTKSWVEEGGEDVRAVMGGAYKPVPGEVGNILSRVQQHGRGGQGAGDGEGVRLFSSFNSTTSSWKRKLKEEGDGRKMILRS